ncbi:RNA polymerase sigma factor [Tengunoibacter tsumagoiensis]|uniref:RNA polymerase sigma factor n=1 Tax=Tengunoibacter tsumagoiensis TaxID=2014871 RepID=A0A401ZVX9_9CHLR|nr:RNA polymerase sigma factor [Tengunoibacter tsumagoiensis]GCE11063.1 RNA polymerase sigma factor [Tengunoibacter tsumagoiensis]
MKKTESLPAHWLDYSDGVLVQHVLAGDQSAFEALMDRYHPMLYRFIYQHLGEYDQACDVIQQVFLKLFIALPTLPNGEMLKPWLFRVAQNCCRDELRKRRRRRVTLFSTLEWQADEDEMSPLVSIPDTRPLPDEIAEDNEMNTALLKAIQALPVKFRSVVLLRYMYQCSFSEIGQTLEMPMTTAKTYYYRACLRLRSALTTW